MDELLYLSQFMLPEVSIKVRLLKKNLSFCLMSADEKPEYIVDIEEAKLRARYTKIAHKFHGQVQKRFSSKPAVYTIYNSTEVRTRQLVAERRLYSPNNLFGSERVPNHVIFAMVKHSSYLGNYQLNPLNLQHLIWRR